MVRSCLVMRVSHVGKHHMTTRDGHHYARANCFQLVPFVCNNPLYVQTFHQNSPLLGHAIRFGEADHPGPSKKNTCLLNVVVANPTSVANKKDTFEKLFQQENIQILCLAETSATKEVQKTCQRSLNPLQLKCFWSQPVPPQRTCINGEDSIRGRAGGCAIFSATGMRYCRNPLPQEWQSTTRAIHTVANFGNSHFQIVTIYGLPQNNPEAKNFLNQLLSMVLKQVLMVPLPYIICGDFNMELHDLPVWCEFAQRGCQDLIQIHQNKYAVPMPPTCLGATRPDNAILSQQLVPLVGVIKVLDDTWFATHAPVLFSLQLPKPDVYRCKLSMPTTWVELGVESEHLAQAYQELSNQLPLPNTLEEWGQYHEAIVDHAVRTLYQQNSCGPMHLTRKYRGRCLPRTPKKMPVYSPVKNARSGEYSPSFETLTMATKRKITQARRIQSLQRRLVHFEKNGRKNEQTVPGLHQEWNKILACTCFGLPFYKWILALPEFQWIQWPIPTSDWTFQLSQIVQHEVTSAVAHDHALLKKKLQFARTCDRRYHGSTAAFQSVKERPPLPITEIAIPHESACDLQWFPAENKVRCTCDNPEFFDPMSPVNLNDGQGWITCVTNTHIEVTFHSIPENREHTAVLKQSAYVIEPKRVAEQLCQYWLPLWQNQHDVNSDTPWDDFQKLLDLLPTPPEDFRIIDTTDEWMKAIKKMNANSSRGFDAVSAQELKLLPIQVIDALRAVCQNYENGFPEWFMAARVCQLNKTDHVPRANQSRPICILSQIYRLQASVRCSQLLRFWHSWFPPEITGMLPTRGSFEAAYGVQAMIEQCRHAGTEIAGLTLDLMKCFNCIRHQAGRRLLLALGVPKEIVHQWFLSIQKLGRYWQIAGETFGPHTASCGFAEGDSHSVLVMLGVALLFTSVVKTRVPEATTGAYADNWSITARDSSRVGPATAATIEVTDQCGLTIDWNKTWMWSTSTGTAKVAERSLRENLPDSPISRLHNARDLGLELHYSGIHKVGHRQERYDRALTRLQKLMVMPHDISTKEHMVRASIFPTAFYVAEIFPVAEDVLNKFRSHTAEAIFGKSPSMTPCLALLLTRPCILDPAYYVTEQAIRAASRWLRTQTQHVQKAFFITASQFQGMTTAVKGPAAALQRYLAKLTWQIDSNGYIHVDTFIKLHIVNDSFQRIKHFLILAWQQQLLTMHSQRYSLFHMPDISRVDTCGVLRAFPDKERRFLIREIAGAYQLESQKQHWSQSPTGLCRYCQRPDSHSHRLIDCAAFAEIRVPFTTAIDEMQAEGLTMDEFPVIHVHPEALLHRTIQFKQQMPEVGEAFLTYAQERQHANVPFHIYTDGSCLFPSNPSTRVAAFAGVIDLCHNDQQRRFHAMQFLISGTMPKTLQTCFAGRVQGEQTINRGELSALICAAKIPFGTIHTDSQYALSKSLLVKDAACSQFAESNQDLLQLLKSANLDPWRVVKIKAHRNLDTVMDTLDLYHALGNVMADEIAGHTCRHMHEAWVDQLFRMHRQVEIERKVLKQVFSLHLALAEARAAADKQTTTQENTELQVQYQSHGTPAVELLSQWQPNMQQELTFPDSIDDWCHYFSWGDKLAQQLLQWTQTLEWPTEPQGPLKSEVGVSWLELAISFSMHFQRALPVLRENNEGKVRLLMVEDAQDCVHHAVTLADQAATMQKMVSQFWGWMPTDAIPNCKKGLNSSLYAQGFGQSTSGASPRPKFPHQKVVLQFLQGVLHGKSNYGIPFTPTWCQQRNQSLGDHDWLHICKQLKEYRRAWKRDR